MAVVTYKYAMVFGDNVENIAIFENYEDANRISKIVYGDDAFAVDITEWPVGPGYKYINGVFYEPDGETSVSPIPSPQAQINDIRYTMDDMTLMMADMIGGAS